MEELIKTGDEIGKKLCESCIKFCEQKKDMLSLLKGGENDRGYNDELESIIQQIDDEDQESKIKIIKEGALLRAGQAGKEGRGSGRRARHIRVRSDALYRADGGRRAE